MERAAQRRASRLGEGRGHALNVEVACPRDHGPLQAAGDGLVCSQGHEYPVVDGIPVLVVQETEPTQPGYWATPEQIEAARRQAAEPDVHGVDPYVQRLIVGTCGNLYRGVTLTRYPIPDLPLPRAQRGELLLDIGCNWGRWAIAAQRAGYRVVGIDPSFEAIVAARRIAAQLQAGISYLVADARRLPFQEESFDVVFSYSVLQHLSKTDARAAVAEIARVLRPGGESWIQMANACGLRNFRKLAGRGFGAGSGFEVRYWTPRELRRAFTAIGRTSLGADGFFTLNPQMQDLQFLPLRHRAVVRLSEAVRAASRVLPILTWLADSVAVRSLKQ